MKTSVLLLSLVLSGISNARETFTVSGIYEAFKANSEKIVKYIASVKADEKCDLPIATRVGNWSIEYFGGPYKTGGFRFVKATAEFFCEYH